MKQTDIAMLVLIVSITLVVSYFLGNAVLGGDSNRSTEVEKVVEISGEFPPIPEEVFNDEAINLTRQIDIGGNSSTDPFEQGE